MKNRSVLGAIGMIFVIAMPATGWAGSSSGWAKAWHCAAEPVVDFWEQELIGSEATGRARLCTTPFGMYSSMKVRGLTPGNAYTVWWVYVDKPEECVNFPLTPENSEVPVAEPIGYAAPCGLADFFSVDPSGEFLNPLVVFGRMDGMVVNSDRRVNFHGSFRSFQPSPGSQVWLFAFGHGPADIYDKRQLARQLLTPEDPLSG
ncbi:MAG: hypothetical protein AAF270_14755, partial [Pseudomonadota bacterium]